MQNFAILVFFVLPVALTIFAYMWSYYNNKFVNTHKDRQWIAIRNVLTSKIEFIKKGVEYRMPWWKEDTIVRLNKEEMSTPPHKANSKLGGDVIVEARYNILTGRKFDPASGQLTSGADDICEDTVRQAITKTNFADRTKYVADVISTVIDFVIGQYTFDELVTLNDGKTTIYVPHENLVEGQGGSAYSLPRRVIGNRGEFLVALAIYIWHETNYRLRDVGFNVDEVELSQLAAANQDVQKDLDRTQQLKSRKRAMAQYDGLKMTDREKIADVDALPEVAKAEAARDFGNALADGLKAVGDGLKNFGKGS